MVFLRYFDPSKNLLDGAFGASRLPTASSAKHEVIMTAEVRGRVW